MNQSYNKSEKILAVPIFSVKGKVGINNVIFWWEKVTELSIKVGRQI
jgi:hypothetical protein